jgi:hypothetical protein
MRTIHFLVYMYRYFISIDKLSGSLIVSQAAILLVSKHIIRRLQENADDDRLTKLYFPRAHVQSEENSKQV